MDISLISLAMPVLLLCVFIGMFLDIGLEIGKPPLYFILGSVPLILVMFVFSIMNEGNSYKQGQIDAMNEIIKYKLEKQPDGSSKWVEIKEEK